MLDVLMETWRVRTGEIGDFAGNVHGGGSGGSGLGGGGSGGDGGKEFLRGLDESERGLFRVAHEGSKAMKVWMGETKK